MSDERVCRACGWWIVDEPVYVIRYGVKGTPDIVGHIRCIRNLWIQTAKHEGGGQ